MKAEIKEIQEEKKFKPFKIELTVESIEEARLLYHVFNRDKLKEAIFGNGHYNNCSWNYKECANSFDASIFDEISNQIVEQGFEI